MNTNRHPANEKSATLIDLIPAGVRSLDDSPAAQSFWRLLRGAAIAGIAIVGGLILLRVVVGVILAMQVSDAMGHSAEVAGLDASITSWLKSVASLGLGFGMVGLVMRAVFGQLLPFGKTQRGSWKPMAALIAASGLGTATPVAIQSMRGVDPAGLPAHMSEVDPATCEWFAPSGLALINYADHLDGTRRYWNRPGHTPRDSAEAQPVSSLVHAEWLRQQLNAARAEAAARQAEQAAKAEEDRRRAAETAAQAERERQQREHEQALAQLKLQMQQAEAQRAEADRQKAAVQRELEEVARRQRETISPPLPSPSTQPQAPFKIVNGEATGSQQAHLPESIDFSASNHSPEEIPLRQGMILNIPVRGDRVEIWSDGPIDACADEFDFQKVRQPGYHLRFTQGAHFIHVRPANSAATRVFIRKLPD